MRRGRSQEHDETRCRRYDLLPRRGFWRRWLVANALISGVLALVWLLMRTGTKPSRFAYPCQQAAISAAMLAFGGPLVAAVIAARQRITTWVPTPAGLGTLTACLLLTAGLWGYFAQAGDYSGPVLSPPLDYRAQLYHVTDCPQDPTVDRFIGLDNLIGQMGLDGLAFYESPVATRVAGPEGILGPTDVIVIKINYQWGERGGTNVDLLRGLIRRIVDHPDGFLGEVIVCENSQFNSIQNFDRTQYNAQDHALSPHDVVVSFQSMGFNVSHYDWTVRRFTSVGEYSSGDLGDGYVVYDYDGDLHGRVSYPKFRSEAGTYISLRFGIWNADSETYDREHLKFINVPVLKSHHATYGATVAIKHYMGVTTRELNTSSHSAIRYGLMGALLGEIGLADLNIVDAIWINANPNDGPWTDYATATRRDELVASVDPVAVDIWAVKNILIPAFLDNGYAPPWPAPSADPDSPTSAFRIYLDNSMSQILLDGYDVTNDLAQIDVRAGKGSAGDFDGDSDVDAADYEQLVQCFTGADGGPVVPGCTAGDFDGDDDVDCDDVELFQFVWTDPAPAPGIPACSATGVPPAASTPALPSLSRATPNPMRHSTRIAYAIERRQHVRLHVVDVAGRQVRTLVDAARGAGEHVVSWNGQNDHGARVASGVYVYYLETAAFSKSRKIVVR